MNLTACMNILFIAAIILGRVPEAVSQPSETPQAPIHGAWQMGPSLDAGLWGGTTGTGSARFSAHYYAGNKRVYFLGVRDEGNSTYGTIFYFDPDNQIYVDTGSDMPTPVSNYFIAQIDDDGRGHGPGLYIVGGRTGSGTHTNALQVYYPDDNTVATIATDPFPPSPARTPGGVVSVNGKLYCFGGFDSATMYADTWVYDPSAAAGSRWTDTGCMLPTGRSYIATVAVGSLIYAIGGDEYSSSMVPIADTLVLDTDNMAACWQDDQMADLPQANGDAPAVYVAEGALAGGIYVVGGMWPSPGPYRWVFRYDVATDTWQEFPELVIPDPATGRRNQALAYIPADASGTAGVKIGIPGLWTFGGYDGSGTNAMTESSEFFSVRHTCLPALDLLLLN